MNSVKFLDIIDSYQKMRDVQYNDYHNFIKMCDFHHQQHNYSSIISSNHEIIQHNNSILESIYGSLTVNNIENSTKINKSFDYNNINNKPNTPIEKNKKIDIDVSVDSLSDLIHIIDKYTYDEETEYNIDLKALVNIKEDLIKMNNMIGLEDFKKQILNQLLYFIQNLHIDSEADFMHTVLCGPPGTGKTEIATILGTMYSKLGILKKKIFKTVNRSDLVAGYLGQTAIKTSKVIEETLGGCLFIDEAYSLASNYDGDSFTRECIDTLCESLSKHKGELMVIIAGYKDEIENVFFKSNKGLESRFIWRFYLDKYSYNELIAILKKKIIDNNWILDISENHLEQWFKSKRNCFKHYGRDIEQLLSYTKMSHSRRIFGKSNEFRKRITIDDLNNGYDKFDKNTMTEKINSQLIGFYV